jgi:D-alanyl-D-alanine carboxypeptidase
LISATTAQSVAQQPCEPLCDLRTPAPATDRLEAALAAQVAAGAPSALARIEAPRAGLLWEGAAGHLARGESRALRADDAFRVASTTKTVTAVVLVKLAGTGRVMLDQPLTDQLAQALLERWSSLGELAEATPRQLLTHTAGLPDYFNDEAFFELLRKEPSRAWHPAELVDHAATHGTSHFAPGSGFAYSDTGFVIAGLLAEQVTGRPLHEVYRELVFDPLAMNDTWLEGHEPARRSEVAHHYTGDLDWSTISPTIDWAGGGLVTTAEDLVRFVRGLWSEKIIHTSALAELTQWTPGASFPPGHTLRYERYGLGIGADTVEGVELIGHTGFIGAFAFYAPHYDAVLVGTHNDSAVDRRPLLAALCRELRDAA